MVILCFFNVRKGSPAQSLQHIPRQDAPLELMPTASGCQRGRWAESEHPQEVRTPPSEPWALRYRFTVDSVANVRKKWKDSDIDYNILSSMHRIAAYAANIC